MVVLLGALLADVPHSRPVVGHRPRLRPGPDPAARAARRRPTRARPGSSASCTPRFADAGLPAASLWAAVPHYVAVAPNPKGALALLRRLESPRRRDRRRHATSRTRPPTTSARSRRAVELDPDVQAFVERLERAADEESGRPDPGSLPSGDVLAREFQRFLRQRGDERRPAAASARRPGQAIR